jgi:MFS family permease
VGRPGLAVVAGCGLGFSSGWNVGNLGGMASELANAYGIALATVGFLTTALFLTHMAVQIPAGKMSDRFGSARAGAAGLLLICAGDLVGLAAPAPAVAIAGRAITGFGTGMAFIAGSEMVRESGGSPLVHGVFGGIGLGTAGLALGVVPLVADLVGWRAPFWTSLAIAVCALGLLLAAGRRGCPRGRRRGYAPRPQSILRDLRLYRLAALYSASYGLSVIVGNWVVELLQRHSDLNDSIAAAVGSLTLLLAVLTRPLGGWLLRARPHRARTAVGASLAGGGVGTLAIMAARPTWLAVVGCILVGIGAGIPFAAAFTGAARARPDAPAASVGLVNGIANFAVLAGTPLVGLTFSPTGGGQTGFAVIASLWLAALVILPSRKALGAAADAT